MENRIKSMEQPIKSMEPERRFPAPNYATLRHLKPRGPFKGPCKGPSEVDRRRLRKGRSKGRSKVVQSSLKGRPQGRSKVTQCRQALKKRGDGPCRFGPVRVGSVRKRNRSYKNDMVFHQPGHQSVQF